MHLQFDSVAKFLVLVKSIDAMPVAIAEVRLEYAIRVITVLLSSMIAHYVRVVGTFVHAIQFIGAVFTVVPTVAKLNFRNAQAVIAAEVVVCAFVNRFVATAADSVVFVGASVTVPHTVAHMRHLHAVRMHVVSITRRSELAQQHVSRTGVRAVVFIGAVVAIQVAIAAFVSIDAQAVVSALELLVSTRLFAIVAQFLVLVGSVRTIVRAVAHFDNVYALVGRFAGEFTTFRRAAMELVGPVDAVLPTVALLTTWQAT